MTIAVLDYGSGNLHSVQRALAHVGGDAEITADEGRIRSAAALVIPGVGRFGACMRALAQRGLDAAARGFTQTGRPVFGVCLGMQVLLERSDEDPDDGLGVIPGRSRKLPPSVKVPHMGWNEVDWVGTHLYVEGIPNLTRFYFVHSFAPDPADGVTVGTATHGRRFAAAVARSNVFATQFHPEKSGEAGLEIYRRFVKAVASQ